MTTPYRWTDEQIKLLRELWLDGKTIPSIAATLGLATHQVKYKIRTEELPGNPNRKDSHDVNASTKRKYYPGHPAYSVDRPRPYIVNYELNSPSVTKMGELKISAELAAFLDSVGIPEAERPEVVARIRIEIARVLRPKWLGRLERGGELATLSAPQFLMRVHAEDIGPDGTVDADTIRAIDPELMRAVDGYISQRIHRNQDLGDAKPLNFALRPVFRSRRSGDADPKNSS